MKETTHEFKHVKSGSPIAIGSTLFVGERNPVIVDADDPAIGYGDPKDVRSQIFDCTLRVVPDCLGVDDERFSPDLRIDVLEQASLFEDRSQFSLEHLGKSMHADKEILPGSFPSFRFHVYASAWNDIMYMRVVLKLPPPRVEYAEETW